MNHLDELDANIPRPSYLKDAEAHIKKFGRIVGTVGIRPVPSEILERLITRHISTDWGDLCIEDRELNDLAFKNEAGGRLLSSYDDAFDGKTIWIITSGYGYDPDNVDLCHTTIMFPDEY